MGSGGIGTNTTVAACTTADCASASDLSSLDGAVAWTAARSDSDSMRAVSVSCCPHKMNLCHNCDDSVCGQHKTWVSCLAASAVSCCTAGGMINGDPCKCQDKVFKCLPYTPG